jgi:hypothetical protein
MREHNKTKKARNTHKSTIRHGQALTGCFPTLLISVSYACPFRCQGAKISSPADVSDARSTESLSDSSHYRAECPRIDSLCRIPSLAATWSKRRRFVEMINAAGNGVRFRGTTGPLMMSFSVEFGRWGLDQAIAAMVPTRFMMNRRLSYLSPFFLWPCAGKPEKTEDV